MILLPNMSILIQVPNMLLKILPLFWAKQSCSTEFCDPYFSRPIWLNMTVTFRISVDYQTKLRQWGEISQKLILPKNRNIAYVLVFFTLWKGHRPAMYDATCIMYSLHRTSVFPLGTACTPSSWWLLCDDHNGGNQNSIDNIAWVLVGPWACLSHF